MNSIKRGWKKLIYFWNDDSPKSWIIFLVVILPLLFLIIKFVFFPLLSFISGTNPTLVVIETGSMHHEGTFGNIFYLNVNFNSWWDQAKDWYISNNLTKEQVSSFQFKTGMEIGDIIVLSKRSQINLGDIIVFEADQKRPIIHRVIRITQKNGINIYATKGDNNQGQLVFENNIPESKIIGKAVARFPRLGMLKVMVAKIIGI